MLQQLLNIIFPVKCVACGSSRDNTLLCSNCSQLRSCKANPLDIDYKNFVLFDYDDKARKIIAQIKYQKIVN